MGSIDAVLDVLGKTFSGSILRPRDDGYDEARTIFNAMIDRRPAVVVQPHSADDVVAAIDVARNNQLEISVRSGGHGVTGAAISNGGLTIDMRRMNAVEVDVANKVARVGGGARWSDFDSATQQHALGATGGRVSTTGVAGLTLGGGSGWIERKYGLASDSLRAVELVTANGALVRASDEENAELFWALRGGGGNFGIVTAFEFALRPLGPELFVALMMYKTEDAEAVARNYRDFVDAGAPRELGGGVAFLTGPPEEFVPAHLQGTVVCGQILTWCGNIDEAEKELAPLLEFGTPELKLTMPVPYVGFQSMLDDPPGFRNYWAAEYLTTLSDEIIDIWARYGRTQRPSPTQLLLFPWGGAIKDGPDTAFSARDANWVFHPLCLWEKDLEDEFWIKFARESRKEIAKFGIGTSYVNFDSGATDDKVPAAFGAGRYARLQKVKTEWDPDNAFHLNNNIKPA